MTPRSVVPTTDKARRQRGVILLPVVLLIFTLALTAVGFVGRLLWQDADRSWPRLLRLAQTRSLATTPSPTTSTAIDDPLLPAFTVEPALQSDYAELEQQLLRPLRAYYATKSERLGPITVAPSDQATHSTVVTFELIDGSQTQQHRFYYDRQGTDQSGPYPKWEPGLLDITK